MEEQEVGYSIHDGFVKFMVKETNMKKKSPLDQIQQNILDLALQVCSYWLFCDDRQVPLPLHGYHCFVQTLLQGSEFQAQLPKSLSLWLENLYGIAIGLPSSSHLVRTRTPTTHVMS